MSGDFPTSGCRPKNITTSTNTLVKTGGGLLFGATINTPQAGASLKLYDGLDNTGTLLGTFSAAAAASFLMTLVGVSFATGLFAVTAGGTPADITVYYF